MNVECQTIRVPTGVQDYRPALYGGIAAIELGVDRRLAGARIDVDPRELERRIVLAYTGAPRNSGTNNWEITKRHIDGDRHVFDCFERIRDTAVAMRTALERGDWDEVGRQIAIEWDNRKRLAPGVTTPTIDELDRARDGRRRDRGQGLRRRRRRLPVLLRSAGRARRDRRGARRRRRAPARLPDRNRRACGLDNAAIARILREIADLLEIKGENPFKIRAYRNGADIAGNHPHELSLLDETGLREIPGIGKDLAARIREIGETGDCRLPSRADRRVSADDPRPAAPAGRRTEDRRDALSRARRPHARGSRTARCSDGRIRALEGHGREEGSADPQGARRAQALRRPAPAVRRARGVGGAAGVPARARARRRSSRPVGSLRRGCDTCGDLDLLATGAPASLMDDFVDYPLVERVLGHGDTKSSVLVQGGFQADLRLVAAESRGAAMQYFTGSKAHNIALRDRAIGLGFKLNEYGLFRIADDEPRRRRARGGHLRRARPRLRAAGAARNARRDRRRRGARAAAPDRARRPARRPPHAHHRDRRQGRHPDDGGRRRGRRGWSTSRSPITASRWRWPTASTSAARSRTPRAFARSTREGLGIRLLAGIECDIKPDGSLDLADDCLAALDIVVASVHSAFNQDRQEMTDRVLRAIENPHVDILGHPTGRMLLKRQAYPIDVEAVIDAAARQRRRRSRSTASRTGSI